MRPKITIGFLSGSYGPVTDRWGYQLAERREYSDGLIVLCFESRRSRGDRTLWMAYSRRSGTGGYQTHTGFPMRGTLAYAVTGSAGELAHFVRRARLAMPSWDAMAASRWARTGSAV